MITYSITLSVSMEVQTDWLEWMMLTHIPDVMRTGHFTAYEIFQVIEPEAPEGKINFTILYTCESLQKYRAYKEKFGHALMAQHQEKFGKYFEAKRELLAPLNIPEGKIQF